MCVFNSLLYIQNIIDVWSFCTPYTKIFRFLISCVSLFLSLLCIFLSFPNHLSSHISYPFLIPIQLQKTGYLLRLTGISQLELLFDIHCPVITFSIGHTVQT